MMRQSKTPQKFALETVVTIRLYTNCFRDGKPCAQLVQGHTNIPDSALIRRINTWLSDHNTDIRVRRLPDRLSRMLGRFYLIDLSRGRIEDFNINLLDLARYLDLIHEQESIAA